jgi:hypothetical protein
MQLSAVAVYALCNCGNEHVCICAAIIDLSLQHDALFVNIAWCASCDGPMMGFVFFVDVDEKALILLYSYSLLGGGERLQVRESKYYFVVFI